METGVAFEQPRLCMEAGLGGFVGDLDLSAEPTSSSRARFSVEPV